MYSLKESDLMPGSTCDFEATGDTKEEVSEKLFNHAKEVHADMMAEQTPEQTQATMQKADELLSAQDETKAE